MEDFEFIRKELNIQNVNATNNELMKNAILNNRIDIVEKLLDLNVDPNTITCSGMTPFVFAVSKRRVPIAKLLVDRGADPNLIIGYEFTNVFDCFVRIYNNGNNFDHRLFNFLLTLNIEFDKKIISYMSNVVKNIIFSLPLFAIKKIIKSKGYDKVLATCFLEEICHHSKYKFKRKDLIKFLIEKCGLTGNESIHFFTKSSALTTCCCEGDIESVEYLLKKGVDVNYKNVPGMSAMNSLCYQNNRNNIHIAQLLISYGANIIENGPELLEICIKNNMKDMILLLLSHGVEPKINLNLGLSYDIVTNYKMVKFLLEKCKMDINLNVHGYLRNTPLMDAAYCGDLKLVKYFLNKGADVSLQNEEGKFFTDFLTEEERLELGPLIYPGSKIKKVKTEEEL